MVYYTTNAVTRTALDAETAAIDGGTTNPNGKMRIYAGAVPADADAPLGGATQLTEHELSNPCFNLSTDANPGATATANAVQDEDSSLASGDPSFYRVFNRDDVTVGQGSTDELTGLPTTIPAGVPVSITSWVRNRPENQ